MFLEALEGAPLCTPWVFNSTGPFVKGTLGPDDAEAHPAESKACPTLSPTPSVPDPKPQFCQSAVEPGAKTPSYR